MTYAEELNDQRWINRREEIILRDKWTCTACGKRPYIDDIPHTGEASFTLISKANTETAYLGLKIRHEGKQLVGISDGLYDGIREQGKMAVPPQSVGLLFRFIEGTTEEIYFSGYFMVDESKKNQIRQLIDENQTSDFTLHFIKELNVHHKYYQDELKAWEYPDEALTTLCAKCHTTFHINGKVKWLNKYGVEIGFLTPCGKCGGSGWIPEYWYYEGGICFDCYGAGYEEFKGKTITG